MDRNREFIESQKRNKHQHSKRSHSNSKQNDKKQELEIRFNQILNKYFPNQIPNNNNNNNNNNPKKDEMLVPRLLHFAKTKNRDTLEKVLINLINKNDPHILNILKDLMPLSKYGPKFETRYYHPGDYEKCYDPECGNLPYIFQITLNHFLI